MPVAIPPRFAIGAAEPRNAVAMFQRRGLLAPTFRWDDIWQEEHSRSFMVAGVAQADVLRLFSDSLQQALATGASLSDWAKTIKPKLASKGWWGKVEITDPATGEIRNTTFNRARLQLIYDTNLRQSYAAGRWAAAERTRRSKPFLYYRTMRDERVRESHRQWDGLALPIDHPFWRTHYAPNGWRCRCRVYAVSERDLQRMRAAGLPVRTTAPEVVTRQVRTRMGGPELVVPVGIDPGFAYNPGQASIDQAGQLQRQALDGLPQPLAAALVRQAVGSRAFARLVAEPLAGMLAPVAVLPAGSSLRTGSATVVLRGDDLLGDLAGPGPLAADASLYRWVQPAISQGRALPGRRWLLQRDGQVVLVRLAVEAGQAVLAQLRMLPLAQARRDGELGPLLGGGA